MGYKGRGRYMAAMLATRLLCHPKSGRCEATGDQGWEEDTPWSMPFWKRFSLPVQQREVADRLEPGV